MQTLYDNEAWTAVSGTALRGYVTTTRRALEAVFGKPTADDDESGDKVTTEWVVDFGDTIATIYDWKRYEDGAPDMDEVYEWHIGGKMDSSENVELLVRNALEGSNNNG